MKLNLVIALAITTLFGVACSKSKGGGAAAAVGYYQSDNTCYNNINNQVADLNSCAAIPYYFQGNQCITRANGYPADMNSCLAYVGTRYYMIGGSCRDKQIQNGYVDQSLCYSSGASQGYLDAQGVCRSIHNQGQVLPQTSCSGTQNGRYGFQNDQCIDRYTGTPTYDISRCTNYQQGGERCLGHYYEQYRGETYLRKCSYRRPCIGLRLIEPDTGRTVFCR